MEEAPAAASDRAGDSPSPAPTDSPAAMDERYLAPQPVPPWAADLLRTARPGPGDRVLDSACGTGAVTRLAAAAIGPGGTVTALDVSPPMLAVGRTIPPPPEATTISWVQGDAQALPFSDASVDLACCQQGLQFIPDPVGALWEMRRVVHPGGQVAISVSASLDRQPVYGPLNRAMARHAGDEAMAQPFSLGGPGEVERLLRAAGFDGVRVTTRDVTVRSASAHQFVRLSILGAVAVVRRLAETRSAERDRLVQAIRDGARADLAPFVVGDELHFPAAITDGTGETAA